MIVSEQLNYIKTRRFHAIFMPVLIEFSRCIGTYSSAKFELYENSEENRIAREKREEAHRQYLEEQRKKEEIQQRYEKEVDNTIALVNQAKDYEIACQIRNYIFALCKEGELTEEKSKWIEWAKKKADWYDPTVAREDEYLGKRNYSLAEEEKELAKKRRSGFYGW